MARAEYQNAHSVPKSTGQFTVNVLRERNGLYKIIRPDR